MTQSHAKSQIEAAEGRAQLAQSELLRLQVRHIHNAFLFFLVVYSVG